MTNAAPLQGQAGGSGGQGTDDSGGGGGGAGGYGAIITGSGLSSSNTSTISGGNGGRGGNAVGAGFGVGGGGGDGGIGVFFANGTATLVNSGTITGGNGGQFGTSASGVSQTGANGVGGVGISGSSLTIINAGTISGGLAGDGTTRANAITFTGGTNVLQLQAGYSFTGNVVDQTNAGSFQLGGSTNASFDVSKLGAGNQFQGFSTYTKTGTSTWTLTNTNAASTPWTVNQGTLSIASDGALGATSGGLTLNGGTLATTASFSTSRAITLGASGGSFAPATGTTYTITTAIGGTGALTMAGAGKLTLTGTSSYTGTTTINSGTLEVDGSLSSGVITVNSGATLTGAGTITDPIIASGGTLAPGNAATPYGTLTITGPLTFQAGSNYTIAITPTANSRTNVVGATTISGGTVNVTASNTSYPLSTKYTILNATGGVTGTFSSVNTNLAFLTPALGYDANNVYLTVTTTNAVLTPASSATAAGAMTTTVAGTTYVVTPDYRTAAATQNQLAVATALTFAAPANPNAAILTALNGTTAAQAQAAFDGLSGEGIAGAVTSGLMQSQMFTGAMTDQAALWMEGGSTPNAIVVTAPPAGALGYAALAATQSPIVTHDAPAPTRTWRAWGAGFGADATIHSLGLGVPGGLGAAAETTSIYGGAVGLDYQVDPSLLLGLAGGGSSGSFVVAGRGTSGAVTGGHVGAYAVKTYAGFYGLVSLAGSFYGDTETRMVAGFGGLAGETERGTTAAQAIRARLEAGRPVDEVAGATLTPFVALEVASLHTNGFTETPLAGAGVFALNVMGQDTLSIPAYLGVRLDHTYALDGGMSLKPVVSVAYGHDFAANRALTATLATLPAALFQVNGAPLAQNFAETKLGVELAFAPGAALFASFDGDFSGREQIYGGKGGIKVMW